VTNNPDKSKDLREFVELFERKGWHSFAKYGYVMGNPSPRSAKESGYVCHFLDSGVFLNRHSGVAGLHIYDDGRIQSRSGNAGLRMLWQVLVLEEGDETCAEFQSKRAMRNMVIAKFKLKIAGSEPIKITGRIIVHKGISAQNALQYGEKAGDLVTSSLRHVLNHGNQMWRSSTSEKFGLGVLVLFSDGTLISQHDLHDHPYGAICHSQGDKDARPIRQYRADLGHDFFDDEDDDYDDDDDPLHYDLDDDFGPSDLDGMDDDEDDDDPGRAPNYGLARNPFSIGGHNPYGALRSVFGLSRAEDSVPSTLRKCFSTDQSERTFFCAESPLAQNLDDLHVIEVRSANVLNHRNVTININYPEVTIKLKGPVASRDCVVEVGSNNFFNMETKSLSNADLLPIRSKLSCCPLKRDFAQLQAQDPSLVFSGCFRLDSSSRPWVEQQIHRLMTEFADVLTIENGATVAPESVKTDVKIFSGDKIGIVAQFHFLHGSKSICLPSPASHFSVLSALYFGFTSLNRLMGPTSRRIDKTLKGQAPELFSHRGIALYLIHRMAGIATFGLDEGLSKSEVEAKIYKEFGALVLKCGAPDSMESVYSKRSISDIKMLITGWLNEILAPSRTLTIVDGVLIEVEFTKPFYLFVYNLCQSLVEISGVDTYTKKQSRSMPLKDYNEANIWGPTLCFPIDRATDRVGHFIAENTAVFIDNSPLERVSASDFKTEMVLKEAGGVINWFDLHPRTFFKGQEISTEDSFKFSRGSLVEHEGKFYIVPKASIPSLKWLDFFWTKVRQHAPSAIRSEFTPHPIFAVPPNEVLNMLALRRAGIPIVGSPRWLEIEAAFDELAAREEASSEALTQKLQGELGIPLKDFQAIGTQWFMDHYKIEVGGILADDMGLGKTVQAIAFLKALHLRGDLGQSLVVVPTSLIFNWRREFLKFAPDLPVAVFDPKSGFGGGEAKSPKIWIASYGLLMEHEEAFNAAGGVGNSNEKWNVVIFDEAQNLKNIRAKRTSCARALPAKIKFALTGTPMENHYGEFYSLVDLVASGALGRYEDFMQTYGTDLTVGSGGAALREQVGFLRMKTNPILLRRTKDRILRELPEKTETLIPLEFEKTQKKIYRDTAIAWNDKVQEILAQGGKAQGGKAQGSQIHILTALMRLRQICSYPGALPSIEYAKVPPKFEALLEALEELKQRKEPVIVFTNFKTTLDALEKFLNAAGILTLCLHGQVPAKKRETVLAEFEKCSEHVVLLMTQKVGGVGLNLTRASYVFHMEPWWNPAVENQATDRVHRIGQTRSVQVYRYVMTESVEEKIQLLKSRKAQLFGDLMNDESHDDEEINDLERASKGPQQSRGSKISREDFEYLLDV
jgi:superfamily II DNA or RNA helicase